MNNYVRTTGKKQDCPAYAKMYGVSNFHADVQLGGPYKKGEQRSKWGSGGNLRINLLAVLNFYMDVLCCSVIHWLTLRLPVTWAASLIYLTWLTLGGVWQFHTVLLLWWGQWPNELHGLSCPYMESFWEAEPWQSSPHSTTLPPSSLSDAFLLPALHWECQCYFLILQCFQSYVNKWPEESFHFPRASWEDVPLWQA